MASLLVSFHICAFGPLFGLLCNSLFFLFLMNNLLWEKFWVHYGSSLLHHPFKLHPFLPPSNITLEFCCPLSFFHHCEATKHHLLLQPLTIVPPLLNAHHVWSGDTGGGVVGEVLLLQLTEECTSSYIDSVRTVLDMQFLCWGGGGNLSQNTSSMFKRKCFSLEPPH